MTRGQNGPGSPPNQIMQHQQRCKDLGVFFFFFFFFQEERREEIRLGDSKRAAPKSRNQDLLEQIDTGQQAPKNSFFFCFFL
jgi:hypothetical protein